LRTKHVPGLDPWMEAAVRVEKTRQTSSFGRRNLREPGAFVP
jgi:hypothetical protein